MDIPGVMNIGKPIIHVSALNAAVIVIDMQMDLGHAMQVSLHKSSHRKNFVKL